MKKHSPVDDNIRERPCYVSDCQSGESPKRDNLCCDQHWQLENLARFQVEMALIIAEGEQTIRGLPPN